MRDTKYATERVIAEINGNRIERIFVKAENQDEIRFSWWPDQAISRSHAAKRRNQRCPAVLKANAVAPT